MSSSNSSTAFALAERGVRTLDDLAELAVDEIIDIDGMDEDRAAKLIMAARAPMIARLEHGA
jgi:transcription termination/antitermination protein NusA